MYIPDVNVSWVEATITKGHVIQTTKVDVVVEPDETEEDNDHHPQGGSVVTVEVKE